MFGRGHHIDRDSLFPADKSPTRTLDLLAARERNHHHSCAHPKLGAVKNLPSKILKRLDTQHPNLVTFMLEFRQAMKSKRFNRMDMAAKQLVNRILNHNDTHSNPEDLFVITPRKKQEREMFTVLGGIYDILQFMNTPPFGAPDIRNVPPHTISIRSETWNELLIVLREIAYAIPSMPSQVFSVSSIKFFFTLTSQPSVFDNCVQLIEEILSNRNDSFPLILVPNLYKLIEGFPARQLAHFCRLLSLLLFEPEDRKIMEGSHTLKSYELLDLRRDRMSRMSTIVETNQTLMLEMPGFLNRIITLLRLVNYAPPLADIMSHRVMSQAAVSNDLLNFKTKTWDDFYALEKLARAEEGICPPSPVKRPLKGTREAARGERGSRSVHNDDDNTEHSKKEQRNARRKERNWNRTNTNQMPTLRARVVRHPRGTLDISPLDVEVDSSDDDSDDELFDATGRRRDSSGSKTASLPYNSNIVYKKSDEDDYYSDNETYSKWLERLRAVDSRHGEATDEDIDPPIILEDDDDHIEVLRAFTPERSDSANGEGGRFIEVGTIANVMRMAIDLGIARPTANGNQLLTWFALQNGLPMNHNFGGNDENIGATNNGNADNESPVSDNGDDEVGDQGHTGTGPSVVIPSTQNSNNNDDDDHNDNGTDNNTPQLSTEFTSSLLNPDTIANIDNMQHLEQLEGIVNANLDNEGLVAALQTFVQQTGGNASILDGSHADELEAIQALVNPPSNNVNADNNINSGNGGEAPTISTSTTTTTASTTTTTATTTTNRNSLASPSSPANHSAQKELTFHSLLLLPHQVELLFVMCTLLTGRRKLDVQKRFAELGLAPILYTMFRRMSWGIDHPDSMGMLEHIHGPNCECNPESALRIQYLRLVHNFYDRDFLKNRNKALLISNREQNMLHHYPGRSMLTHSYLLQSSEKGLIHLITEQLLQESAQSPYRFWLSCCLESFLRGSGSQEQLFLTRCGLLTHITKAILSDSKKCEEERKSINKEKRSPMHATAAQSIQSAFDLLGELIKGNLVGLEMMTTVLGSDFDSFIEAVMNNLVESNVFLRSVFLSMELINSKLALHTQLITSDDDRMVAIAHHTYDQVQDAGYLTHSWVHFCPKPISSRAIVYTTTSSDVSSNKIGNDVKNSYRSGGNKYDRYANRDLNGSVEILHGHSNGAHTTTKVVYNSNQESRGARRSLPTDRIDRSDDNETNTSHQRGGKSRASHSRYDSKRHNDDANGGQDDRQGELFDEEENAFLKAVMTGQGVDEQVDHTNHTSVPDSNDDDDELLANLAQVRFNTPSSDGDLSNTHQEALDEEKLLSVQSQINKLLDARQGVNDQMDHNTPHKKASSGSKSTNSTPTQKSISGTPSSGTPSTPTLPDTYQLPASIYTFTNYLIQERVNILVRLMGTISLKSIDHENICCLNTILLLLLLSHHRGQLPEILTSIRRIANEDKLKENEQRDRERRDAGLAVESDEDEPYEEDREVMSGGAMLLLNFRELLWFWKEYYCRRGRDRLSLEFSGYIHVSHWIELVNILCADDGSNTSLIDQRIILASKKHFHVMEGNLDDEDIVTPSRDGNNNNNDDKVDKQDSEDTGDLRRAIHRLSMPISPYRRLSRSHSSAACDLGQVMVR